MTEYGAIREPLVIKTFRNGALVARVLEHDDPGRGRVYEVTGWAHPHRYADLDEALESARKAVRLR